MSIPSPKLSLEQYQELDFFKHHLSQSLQQALGKLNISLPQSEIWAMLEKPPESKMGDYAFPCFRFAKAAKKNPAAIAQSLLDELSQSQTDWLESIQVAGAFVNFKLLKVKLLEHWSKNPPLKAKLFSKPFDIKILNEFSQPNTHKKLHVGHLRNMLLGDSLCRLERFSGYQVTGVNYFGDEGTHIAKCLWYIQKQNIDINSLDEEDLGAWLGKMYEASEAYLQSSDDTEQARQEISQVLANIEKKQGETYKLWQLTRQWSLDSFKKAYEYLDIQFDFDYFESDLSEDSQKIVDEFLAKDIFIQSDGAIGMDLKDEGLGFLILRKKDGNTLYATKDLVLAREKFAQYNPDHAVVIVGSEQNHHFKQVFKALEKMQFEFANRCEHLSYGLVKLPEGKMSSRKGNVATLWDMVENIESEVSVHLEKYKSDWSEEEVKATQKKLTCAAIRYGMMSTDPSKEVVYDAASWTNFEGDSGPYLLYTYARINGILAKIPDEILKQDFTLKLKENASEELLREIIGFNETIWQATLTSKPSMLTHRIFDLCKAFNRFYAHAHILNEANKDLQLSRIALTQIVTQILRKSLDILGIDVVERM